MIQEFVFWSFLTLSSSLRTLSPHMDCTQQGLDTCSVDNCSEIAKVKRQQAPTGPEWGPEQLKVVLDRNKFIPVLSVSWKIRSTGSIIDLRGSEIHIQDENTNQSMCFQYFYNLKNTMNPNNSKWMFSLYVEVQPEHTYTLSVFNLPEPDIGDYRIMNKITIPGCHNKTIQQTQGCRENGSLWEPQMRTESSLDWNQKMLSIVVAFCTSDYSEKYLVSLKSAGVFSTLTVLKENKTSLNVTFELSLPQRQQCEIVMKIQPFFSRCGNDCWSPEKSIDYCLYYSPRTPIVKTIVGLVFVSGCLVYILWRTFHSAPMSIPHSPDEDSPQCIQMEKRKRLLIIYSLDHPLYKNIVLKLCSFLMAKCGTEVVLDLLDSTRLGVMGGIPWLEWHRDQIEKSSDKILILCSRGVQAKWRSMCNGNPVQLKEDTHSTVGDMLVPALCLIVPQFVRSASFEKYIVAYFDSVSSEDDIPSPFNITVRYKLMKQFEELFFRILDCEKHQMGRVNHIEGLSEVNYHHSPIGAALRNAIEDFQAHQLEHPHWFEEELIENTEVDIESDFVPDSGCHSRQTSNDFTSEETTFMNISKQQIQLSLNL